ncbi:MAG: tRNA guanosine(34) transglycosylase Tgt [Candidatus Blackburnbacteria bacterium]|nr:tRNA guanosine(34) transglycosylase Tgt [Candidatus Blackburnbacteria bacterium]
MFKIIAKDGKARAGILETAHGKVETPVFMPVGTQASVKAVTPQALRKVGAQIILGNTYHLYLRPGHKLIKEIGGLHKFMGWDGPILTDSGGFQAFSLGAMIEHGVRKVENQSRSSARRPLARLGKTAPLVKITEQGIHFVSHLDGTKHLLTPEKSMEVQLALGSDICLVLDELLSPLHSPTYVKRSLERTHRWELRSKDYFRKHLPKFSSLVPRHRRGVKLGLCSDGAKQKTKLRPMLFGILQGVYDREIRQAEAEWITEQGFDGISIGGSFGTSEYYGQDSFDWAAPKAIYQTMEWVVPYLPEEKPRHALGIGEVQDLFECVERGIDMFDCVAPTRRARNGSLYISPRNGGNLKNKFTLSVAQSKYTNDQRPVDQGCTCYTCQNFSRAYLRHLYVSSEILYHQIATIHNLYFILKLTKTIRESILERRLKRLKTTWIQ